MPMQPKSNKSCNSGCNSPGAYDRTTESRGISPPAFSVRFCVWSVLAVFHEEVTRAAHVGVVHVLGRNRLVRLGPGAGRLRELAAARQGMERLARLVAGA